MNASRLLQVIEIMRAVEAQGGLQNILANGVAANLQNLVSNPSAPQLQISLRDALNQLAEAQKAALARLGPESRAAIEELRAREYLLDDLADMVDRLVQANAATLQVALNELMPFIQRRAQFIVGLDALAGYLREMGLEEPALAPGEAELGVRIPRIVFSNSLEGLQAELKALNRIVRALSEVATGSPDIAEVRRISTSDPLFVLGLPLATILLFGKLVTWGLGVWKEVEHIRLVRAQVRKLGIESSEKLAETMEKDIASKVNQQLEAKVKELLGSRYEDSGRPQEQRTDLTQVLGLLLDRIQRGVTIEVRLGPPPPARTEGEDESTGRVLAENYAALTAVRRQLVFPKFSEDPLLFLSKPANDDAGPDTE